MLTGTTLLLTIISALIIGVAAGWYTIRLFLHVFFMRHLAVRKAPVAVGMETAKLTAHAG